MNLKQLKERTRETYLLSHAASILSWDQETYMPPKAIEERGDQLALLQGIIHEKFTDPAIGEALEKIQVDGLDEWDRGYLRKLRHDYNYETKLSKDFVMRLAKTVSASQAAWAQAKEDDNFQLFVPHLEEIVSLVIEKAESIGYEGHPYNALVDEFEPGMTVELLEKVLVGQADSLKDFVKALQEKPQADDAFLWQPYDVAKQEEFSRFILEELGYPMERGRLDVTAHPFTTTLGADDVRITTRYHESFFNSAIFGTIHEAGHGFYELGFGEQIRGNILADGTSLGIHESQSRSWENLVGRSLAFWELYYSKLQSIFPANLKEVSLDRFYRGINKVEPSLIRVEADEVTYNLHIILRYVLEKSLVTKELAVKDLPDAWNETFKSYFGIVPPNNSEGVLQDIHWSMGAIGYFPTYALGNLCAAQFAEVIERELGDIDGLIANKDFPKLKDWFRTRIHQYGSAKLPSELMMDITGKPLSPEPFLSYIRKKYSRLYGLS